MPKTIAVLGGRGMLGSDLVKFLGQHYKITAIDKHNYQQYVGKNFDVLINANGNSRKFWANQNPYLDFEASTISVYKSLFDFKFKKYVYISSVFLYENFPVAKISAKNAFEDRELDVKNFSPYSLHKFLSEQMVKRYASDYLIFRCNTMIGKNAKKGVVFDILNNKELFITLTSKLQLITTKEVANIIHNLISKKISGEIFNVGGKGQLSFVKAEKFFQKKIKISANAEKQDIEQDVSKLNKIFKLKTSEEYLTDFIENLN
ncbi:MAG: NAD-dependent epimerase/dehydratase family protein [Patescibacteria group bacterium]